jgi:hypothetical protein
MITLAAAHGLTTAKVPPPEPTAVAAAVAGDDAVTVPDEEQHLGVPVVGSERPAVVEHDRLRVPGTPVLVEDLDPVLRGDHAHRCPPDEGGWIRGSLPG